MFCSDLKLNFRPAKEADFYGSILREKALTLFMAREVQLEKGEILTDGHNPLKLWQVDSALDHWRVIRSVLADEIWINY
jgi:hypothetical protein